MFEGTIVVALLHVSRVVPTVVTFLTFDGRLVTEDLIAIPPHTLLVAHDQLGFASQLTQDARTFLFEFAAMLTGRGLLLVVFAVGAMRLLPGAANGFVV